MPVFNNVELYFSILKYRWRTIRDKIPSISIKELIECMMSITGKKKQNIKKHWLEKVLEYSQLFN